MKNLSKILAVLLVLTMCMSLFCISAFAEENQENPDNTNQDVVLELAPDDGNDEGEKVEAPAAPAAPADEEEEEEAPAAPAAPAADEEEEEEAPAAPAAPADEEEEAPAAPAAPAELEEDAAEKEKAPWVGPFAKTGDENSSSSESTFKANALPSSYVIGSGPLYGSCDEIKSGSGWNLFYGTSESTCYSMVSVLSWYDYGGGAYYISGDFLKTLPVDAAGTDYYFQFKNGSKTSAAAKVTISMPDLSLWPLDTPKHVLGSSNSLSFVATDAPGSPTAINSGIGWVMVGDVVLVEGRDYYLTDTIGVDGVAQAIITLSPYFLNKLTSGASYTLKITDGTDVATSNFSIVGYGTSTSSPRTGDESNIGLWAVLLLLSGTAAVVIVPRIKKHGM